MAKEAVKSGELIRDLAERERILPPEELARVIEGLLVIASAPLAVEERLMRLVPEEFRQDAHHWLILHGRYVCKARNPECPSCLINDLCEFRGKVKTAANTPRTTKKKPD